MLFKLLLVASLSLGGYADLQASFGFINPNPKELPEVDSVLGQAEKLVEQEKYEEALILFSDAIEKSKEMDYSKGATKAYVGAASILYLQNKLEQATQFLIKAKDEPYAKQSPEDMHEIYFREGLNLHVLGLYDQAIRRYKESIEVLKKIKNSNSKTDNFYKAYINIGDVYQLKNQNDSALYFYRTAHFSPTKDLDNKFVSAISLADVFMEQNQLDSAFVYLKTSENLSQKIGSKGTEAMYDQILGKYYEAIGKNDSAILFYKRSFALKKELKRPDPRLLKKLSEIYGKIGEQDISNQYLSKYVSLNDSLSVANKNNVQVPVLLAKNASKQKLEKAESKTTFLLVILGFSFLTTAVFVYLYIKKQKQKNTFNRVENTQLKKKLNTAFEEVAELAQTNSPTFLSRFIEVYPEFYNNLISTYPDLTNADLKLCALMKLDYSTKEISEITYSSIRTVQNRKYKLRKKFGLASDENLNLWIQNLHIQTLNMV